MNVEPIGIVRTCFGSKFAIPRQPGLCPSAWGELSFHEPFRSREALRGIEGFSHLWLVFGFHETAAQGWKPTVRPPRLGGNQRIGVFASRSTFRPNSLGLSLVKLEEVLWDSKPGPTLLLGGLDLMDGTPVYDIKPYLSYAESIPDALSGFAGDEIPRLEIIITPEAEQAFEKLPERAKRVIIESLSLDPRPAVRKDDSERVHGACLCGHDVRFIINRHECRIVEIKALPQDEPKSSNGH